LGFSRLLGWQMSRETAASGALGILTVKSNQPTALLNGGRAFQRLWLVATSLGLGVHPAAGLPVLLDRRWQSNSSSLLKPQQRLVRAIHERSNEQHPELSRRTVQMIFRLGYPKSCKIRSLRRPVNDQLIDCPKTDPVTLGSDVELATSLLATSL
jgi:hypothetical protein